MAKEIKPGMLCWLTRTLIPENNGLVVEVIQRYTGPCFSPNGEGPRWIVRTRDKVKLRMYVPSGAYKVVRENEFNAATWQLIPFSDPDLSLDEVKDRELEEV